MNLALTTEQAEELEAVLGVALRELTHEIAATDNAGYRAELTARRSRLVEISERLGRQLLVPSTFDDDGAEALFREMAWPGD
jgi:hypothetical protein